MGFPGLLRVLLLGLVALVMAVPVAGCGGDEGSDEGDGGAGAAATAPEPSGDSAGAGGDGGDAGASAAAEDEAPPRVKPSSLSKAEFVKQADQMCRRERRAQLRRAGRITQELGEGDLEGNFEALSRRVLAPTHVNKAEEIRQLGAPRGDVAQIEALVKAMRQDSAALASDPAANPTEYTAALRRSTRLAGEYGFTECASVVLF